ncbi:phage holin family protein [Larsenimonas suaedae]|uniref:Phage holin family protein n=1 Tax=Larsenimonas suaedae TaxID=1851019 RepID=A0ABU1GZ23_9GAMM|nr:phage holin family protein [Larsenimonas suaedae]MCM2973775.1 phage holin family protein [Larsenimonas suaedae]MDR5897299.1 phage holin family protein [Larsenimonas suaedae]
MPFKDMPPDFQGMLGAFIISVVSGVVSIMQRIVRGHDANVLWIISEFLAAVLCGYLMYDSYFSIAKHLPGWMTLPVAIALSAHIGGRSLQALETMLYRKYGLLKARDRP